MKDRIEAELGDSKIYHARNEAFKTDDKVPFRVSPTPLTLTPEQKRELENIGNDVVAYVKAVDELYRNDQAVRELLNTGKPDMFLVDRPTQYLFVRPDIVITKEGFRICEIETSPFGLALAQILNKAYRQAGFETLVTEDALPQSVRAATPTDGRIIFSNKTQAYSGQMDFLAEKVFSDAGREWTAHHVNDVDPKDIDNLYRGFYLSESLQDEAVRALLEKQIQQQTSTIPSLTPHMEEKANLALIWDKRFEDYFKKQLGVATFDNLRKVIPPNWIVGQEKHFAPGLPGNMQDSIGLATLSRSKRAFVLKSSGFSGSSSWGEGVDFLHKASAADATQLLTAAHQDASGLHVVQTFTKGTDHKLEYIDEDGQPAHMHHARIRLTPYFSAVPGQEGSLVAVKATGRENTDYIHGATDSINTAVE